MRAVRFLNLLLAAALVLGSLYVYPELPERIPLHFGADGEPDRWGDRSLLMWMLLPVIGIASALLMYAIARAIPSRPHLVNMPDRKKLLELPPQLQQWVIGGVADLLHLIALCMLLLFGTIQVGAWESARSGSGSSWIVASMVFGLAVMPFISIGGIFAVQKRLDRAWHEHRTKGPAAGIPR